MRQQRRHQYRLFLMLLLSLLPVWVLVHDLDITKVGGPILTTLAGIQASIFAIVFSVVILGVQLSTSQYSPRLTELFRSDRIYLKTVSIFAISIGTSVCGLFLLGLYQGIWMELWIYFSGILTIIGFVSLFNFVDRTLEQTTPEGVLRRLEGDLSPKQIIRQCDTANGDNSEPDPFLVLVSVVNSQIDERDAASVFLGLEILRRRVKELLSQCTVKMLEEDAAVGESLEDLCTSRLVNSGENAVSSDLDEGAEQVVNTLKQIGCDGVDDVFDRPVLFAVQGLSDLCNNLGFDELDERVRGNAIASSRDVLTESAEAGLWEGTGKATRYFSWQMANSVYKRNEGQNFGQKYTSAILLHFPSILRELVDTLVDEVDDNSIRWKSTHPAGEFDSYTKAKSIQSVYIAMSEVTSSFIRYELRTQVNLVDWEDIAYGWVSCLSDLPEDELQSFRNLWIATVLYLEYLADQSPDGVMKECNPRLRREVSSEAVIGAIDKVLDENIDPTTWMNFRQTVNPLNIEKTGYSFSFNLSQQEQFEEWLQHRKEVLERTSSFSDTGGWASSEEIADIIDTDNQDETDNSE